MLLHYLKLCLAPQCLASLHTEGVKGKCQPNAFCLAASGPLPADSDHLLCQVIVGNLTPAIGKAFNGAARVFMKENNISNSDSLYFLSPQS